VLEGGKQACHWHPCTTRAEIVRRLEHPSGQVQTCQWHVCLTTGTPQEWSRTGRPPPAKRNGKCLLHRGMPVAFRGGQACPPEQPDTNRIRMNDKQAFPSPSGHIEALRAGVEMCQWHIDLRRELSCSYLAGRRSRPDRREGCQAPCPPNPQHLIPRLTEERQHRRAGNRGKEGRPCLPWP